MEEYLFEGTVQIYESILQLGALSQRDTSQRDLLKCGGWLHDVQLRRTES